jgi:hypothetical protein
MASPFDWVTERAQPGLLVVLTVLLASISIWLFYVGQELVTPEAPRGIVSFELARHSHRAASVIDSWSPRGAAAALVIQGLDFLYLFVYPAWFSLAALRLGTQVGGVWHRSASVVSWAVLGCAPLDALENLALIQQLVHGPSQACAQLAWWCAIPKFMLVVLGGSFLLVAACAWLLARMRAA